MHIVDFLEFVFAAVITFGFILFVYSIALSYVPELDLYEPYTLMSFGLLGFILILLRTDLFDDIKKKWKTPEEEREEEQAKKDFEEALQIALKAKKEWEAKQREEAKYECKIIEPKEGEDKSATVTIGGKSVASPSKKED